MIRIWIDLLLVDGAATFDWRELRKRRRLFVLPSGNVSLAVLTRNSYTCVGSSDDHGAIFLSPDLKHAFVAGNLSIGPHRLLGVVG